jgi:hypothetical protein
MRVGGVNVELMRYAPSESVDPTVVAAARRLTLVPSAQ